MADKFPKKVLFNNGEGVDFADFNDVQNRIHAHFTDAMNAHRTNGFLNPLTTLSSGRVWAWGSGGAVYNGSIARGVSFVSGLIAVNTNPGPVDGEQQLLTYWMDSADVPDKERPSPGAGNERWDVLSVTLTEVDTDSQSRDFKDAANGALTTQTFNKTKLVEAAFSWTEGTAAAIGTASLPALPATKICAVLVKDGQVPKAEFDELYDYRYPVGTVKIASIAPFEVGLRNPAPSIVNEDGVLGMSFVLQSGENVELYAKCPTSSYTNRLARLDVDNQVTALPADVEERLVTPNEKTITVGTSGLAVKYNHTNDIPMWGNGYSAGAAAEIEGLYPEGIVWKGKAIAVGGVKGYIFHGLTWYYFGE